MLETLSQIGELLGGFGALAALVYLASQIRQNNTIARAHARQTLIDTWSAGNWELARDAELQQAFAAALSHWPDIPDNQKTTFDLGMSRFLYNIQNGLLLRDAGLLDEEMLEQISDYMVISVLSPAGRRWWNETLFVAPDVREYVERRLATAAGLPTMNEAMPHWMSMAENKPPQS